MAWYDAVFLAVSILLGIGGILFLPILLVNQVDTLLEKCRRKKHPEYFKYYDEAVKLSFERGAEYRRRKEYFDYKIKVYNEGLRDGECTNEYYTHHMNKHMVEYQKLCDWFQEEEKKIRELLVKADLYAKEHDCFWGIIYDGRCE
jgi:hypothetical protein